LTNFRAENQVDQIRLAWSTESETNNDFFDVERSADGTSFEAIAKVDGAGTTSLRQDYELLDVEPLDGRSYYRLRQVDRDGQETYSEVVSVSRARDLQLLSLSPNPAQGGQRVALELDVVETIGMEIVVVDLMGRIMFQEVLELAPGIQRIEIPTEGWTSGTYAVKLGAGSQKFARKFILN